MTGRIPFAVIAADVARALLGDPNATLSTHTELRYGARGSLTVHIAGPRAGTWRDHERAEGGGLLDLIARETGQHNGEGVEWLREHGFIAAHEPKPKPERKTVAAYDYCDAAGALTFQVVRFEPKDFRQRRPDGKGGWIWNLQGIEPVLYRLPELLGAMPSATVYVTEGEKDAGALRDRLLVATTCPGGAGKWRSGFNDVMRDRPVVILPDNDAAGEAHALAVAASLHGIAASVRVLRLPGLPPKGDVSDWLAAGGTGEELAALSEGTPEWAPTPDPAPHASGSALPLLLARDITPALDLRHLVRGLLLAGSAALLFGPSGCGKTHLATDLALHVAAGLLWHGRPTERGAVLYVALEGGAGFRNRVAAWLADNPEVDPAGLSFAAVTTPLRLIEPGQAGVLIDTIHAAGPILGAPVRLVVLDTLSRALAGADENDPVAMGALVAAIDRTRAETGAAVLAIHHSGKDATRGARGHSLLRAAVDSEIEVSATGEDRVATVTKQRDLASGDRIGFRLRVLELGHDLAGESVTSCVVDPAGAAGKGARLSKAETRALRVLHDLLAGEAAPLPAGAGFPTGLHGVPETRWRAECDTRRVPSNAEATESRDRAFRRAYQGLLAAGRVAARDGVVWAARSDRGASP